MVRDGEIESIPPVGLGRGAHLNYTSSRAGFPRMSTVHGLLSLARTGALDGGGNHAPGGISRLERIRFHPAIYPADAKPARPRPLGKTEWRMYFSRRRRLHRAARQTAAMPRFPQSLEFPRRRKILSRPATGDSRCRIHPSPGRSHRTFARNHHRNPATTKRSACQHLNFMALFPDEHSGGSSLRCGDGGK